MKTLLAIVALLAVALAGPSSALAKAPSSPALRITEVDATTITVELGKGGDEHVSYKITDGTKITLNGAPVFARDLKAGMVARITAGPDHSTALTVEAKDPPAHPGRHRVG